MPEQAADGGEAFQASSAGGGLFGANVNCREAVHQLYHYLDGELTDENRRLIAEHLVYCHSCSDAAEFEAELRQVISDKCRDHVPDALRRRIADAIEEERRHRDHAGSN